MGSPSLWAIGDIHGQFDTLRHLLQSVNSDFLANPHSYQLSRDTYVFLGDFIDGGPDSASVVQGMINLNKAHPHWVFLRGNHEQLLLNALDHRDDHPTFQLWYQQGGQATFESYSMWTYGEIVDVSRVSLRDVIPQNHIEWLQYRPRFHETENFFFAHAGMRPGIHKADQTATDLLWIRDQFFASGYNFGKPVVYGHTTFPSPRLCREGQKHPIWMESAHNWIDASRGDDYLPLVSVGIDTMGRRGGPLTAVMCESPTYLCFVQQDPVVEDDK